MFPAWQCTFTYMFFGATRVVQSLLVVIVVSRVEGKEQESCALLEEEP